MINLSGESKHVAEDHVGDTVPMHVHEGATCVAPSGCHG